MSCLQSQTLRIGICLLDGHFLYHMPQAQEEGISGGKEKKRGGGAKSRQYTGKAVSKGKVDSLLMSSNATLFVEHPLSSLTET